MIDGDGPTEDEAQSFEVERSQVACQDVQFWTSQRQDSDNGAIYAGDE